MRYVVFVATDLLQLQMTYTSFAMQAPAMTPRTRSLYAYMGESQQPYQSPSKDLDLINGRISGRPPHVVSFQLLELPVLHCTA